MSRSSIIAGYFVGAIVLGAAAIFLLTAFGIGSTDARGVIQNIFYDLAIVVSVAGVSGATFVVVIMTIDQQVADSRRLWNGITGAVVGAFAIIAYTMGAGQQLGRLLSPFAGRYSWFLSISIVGAAAALISIAVCRLVTMIAARSGSRPHTT